MQKQVPTLEACKELAEFGFPQTTDYAWFYGLDDSYLSYDHEPDAYRKVSAPTFQEVWAQIPEIFHLPHPQDHNLGTKPHAVKMGKLEGVSYLELHCGDDTYDALHTVDCANENLGQAAAEMWKWLKEQGYLVQ